MPEPIVVLDQSSGREPLPPSSRARRVRSEAQVREAFASSRTGTSVWLAPFADGLRLLASVAERSARADRRLLVMQEVGCDRRSWLQTLFRSVVSPDHGDCMLPRKELLEVLTADNRDELFVAGVLDRADGMVVLFRGTLEAVPLPLSWFPPAVARGAKTKLDLKVTDFGQTVRLGDYEASTHAILYDLDPVYRRRAKKRLVAQDQSFGGALRRLRNLRGLPRSAFEPALTAREVARIEHGKVARPRSATVAVLARRLRVKPEEIASY